MHYLGISLLCLSVVSASPSLRHIGRHAKDTQSNLRAKRYRKECKVSDTRKGDTHAAVTITLTNHDGMQYTGQVTVGGQHLKAIYDTGSIEVMTVSEHCEVCHIPDDLSIYSSARSRSFKNGSGSIQPHYYAGALVEARQDFETVHIGSPDSEVTATGMPIWQVVKTDLPQWTNPEFCKFTTILGLGHRDSIADTPEVDASTHQLLEHAGTKRFSICLQKGAANPGYVSFNPLVTLDSASLPVYRCVPVVGHRHWAVNQNEVSFDNGEWVDKRCSGTDVCIAIVDSGTSLIGVPAMHMGFVSGLINKMRPDCSNLNELPDLVFRLGGHEFALPSSAYILQLPTKDGSKRCYGAFMELSMQSDMGLVWVLGLPFLRQFYTIWDREQPALYIAEQGGGCEPSNPKFMVNDQRNGTALKLANALDDRREPTIGDISKARLPSWASGQGQKLEI